MLELQVGDVGRSHRVRSPIARASARVCTPICETVYIWDLKRPWHGFVVDRHDMQLENGFGRVANQLSCAFSQDLEQTAHMNTCDTRSCAGYVFSRLSLSPPS